MLPAVVENKLGLQRNCKMDTNNQLLNMNRLFGFSEVVGEVDMAAPALASRLGAKVGSPEPSFVPTDPSVSSLDSTQLLGFETIAGEFDFKDPSLASQVGAKIGDSEPG
jgi:hypothetical protein